jgi:hypothetical protein
VVVLRISRFWQLQMPRHGLRSSRGELINIAQISVKSSSKLKAERREHYVIYVQICTKNVSFIHLNC